MHFLNLTQANDAPECPLGTCEVGNRTAHALFDR